jgi:hypothetical protein
MSPCCQRRPGRQLILLNRRKGSTAAVPARNFRLVPKIGAGEIVETAMGSLDEDVRRKRAESLILPKAGDAIAESEIDNRRFAYRNFSQLARESQCALIQIKTQG